MKTKLCLVAAGALCIGLLLGFSFGITRAKLTIISDPRITRQAYELAYDGQHKQARWVYEHLTTNRMYGDAEREKLEFRADPLIPIMLQATQKDYCGSGFDRGHLCPAADARFSLEAMQ